jgi:hypothetical protein
MSTKSMDLDEHSPGVWRAIRNTQRVLLRNDLDPFEFVVEIHEVPVDEQTTGYVLEISTADGAVSIQKPDLPNECIEGGRQAGSDGLASFVESMLPELLAAMKAASSSGPSRSPEMQQRG